MLAVLLLSLGWDHLSVRLTVHDPVRRDPSPSRSASTHLRRHIPTHHRSRLGRLTLLEVCHLLLLLDLLLLLTWVRLLAWLGMIRMLAGEVRSLVLLGMVHRARRTDRRGIERGRGRVWRPSDHRHETGGGNERRKTAGDTR